MSCEIPGAVRPQYWPDPVEVLNEEGQSPIVLLCEHASNHIPPEYAGLGLDVHDLSRHIAWDIGAAQVTRRLTVLLDAPAFLGTYSRLLVDLNRPPEAASSIPVRSEATDIPGNLSLTRVERQRRLELIFFPFHQRVASYLRERRRSKRDSVIVCIHSFTPVYLGETRPWHAGILFSAASGFGSGIVARLARDPALHVAANVPYLPSPEEDYALFVHGDSLRNPAVLIEVRHDLISSAEGVREWAQRLAMSISESCADLGLTGMWR